MEQIVIGPGVVVEQVIQVQVTYSDQAQAMDDHGENWRGA
uniref:Uncharacterized protein n=1 Tax=Peronospora matthiolae TaxID=2874970 RepID=A0AAV1V8M6_9STRA